MTMMTEHDVAALVIAVIAETFEADPRSIGRQTIALDVSGWDSLGHSILMVRLSKKLGVPIGEDIAAGAQNVGELIDMLRDRLAGGNDGA